MNVELLTEAATRAASIHREALSVPAQMDSYWEQIDLHVKVLEVVQ